jgi:PAS domain S-box-containing protein
MLSELYQQLFVVAHRATIVVDAMGRIALINAEAEKLFEYHHDELVGQMADVLLPPEVVARFSSVDLGKERQTLGRDGNLHGVTKYGDRIPIEVVLCLIEINDGRFTLVSITDISERLQQEVLLTTYRIMVESAPNAMILVDSGGRIDIVNEHTEVLFGYMREELMGMPVTLLLPIDFNRVRENVRDTPPVKATSTLFLDGHEPHGRTKDGREVPLQIGFSPITTNAGTMVVASLVDITDRKRAEGELRSALQAAEAANRAKATFLATMSHEIRTPMNAIIGMTSILIDSPLDTDQREWTNIIRSSGEHLLTVINDILDFSKIEAGKIELESLPFSVAECLETALDLIQVSANSKGVEIGYLIDDSVPLGIHGDISRLRQVLLNLLSNAVKFTPAAGHVFVGVSATPLGNVYEIKFAVQDSGIGLTSEQRGKLFQSFVQADTSTTRKYGGTGLGLSISRRLVELMGGHIDGESQGEGQGSTFQFTILAAPAQGNDTRSNPLSVKPFLQGRRALIVDDIETNRRILNYYTRAWGMEAVEIASGAQALTWIGEGNTYDVALLDYHMPGIDGVELARELSRLRPSLPIVILSSVTISENLLLGVVASTVLKPIRPENLLRVLERIFLENRPHISLPLAMIEKLGETHPLRILVAEDHAINQQVIRLMFHRMGYQPDFATDGVEALNAVERQVYDVVFMDVHMPVMDGLEATKQLCARWPSAERPRIIGLSASALVEDARAGKHAGMDDYLSKPITSEALRQVVLQCRRIRRGETMSYRSTEIITPIAQWVAGEGTVAVAAMAPANGHIDENWFAQLVQLAAYDDNPEALLLLVRGFLVSASKLIGDARSAYDRGDLPMMVRAMHSLKPTAAMFGALFLSGLCAELEAAGSASQVGPLLDRRFIDLHREFEDVRKAFTMRFPRLSETHD